MPDDRVVVAESGIESGAGRCGRARGADAILVGSTLMRATDPATKLAELLSRPLVKVCVSRAEDVTVAADAGADLLGFVLEPASPRAAERVLPVPAETLAVAVWVGEARASDADLDQVHTVEEGKIRGREATLYRATFPSPACSTSRGASTTPHWERAAARGRRPRRRARPGERRRRRCRRPTVGRRRVFVARNHAGRQRPRLRAFVRAARG